MAYRMRPVTIEPALNGWKVKVGCREVLFTNRKEMFAEISKYINDPEAVEKLWIDAEKNEYAGTIEWGAQGNIHRAIDGTLTVSLGD